MEKALFVVYIILLCIGIVGSFAFSLHNDRGTYRALYGWFAGLIFAFIILGASIDSFSPLPRIDESRFRDPIDWDMVCSEAITVNWIILFVTVGGTIFLLKVIEQIQQSDIVEALLAFVAATVFPYFLVHSFLIRTRTSFAFSLTTGLLLGTLLFYAFVRTRTGEQKQTA